MALEEFSYYHSETGVLHGKFVSIDCDIGVPDFAKANAPAGHVPIRGRFDQRTQRVNVELLKPDDVATAEHVIDYQPPQPSADHEWSATMKRWQLTAAAQAKAATHVAAQRRIAELLEQQHHLVRRLVLGDETARTPLQAIDDEVRQQQAIAG
jgi:hypothetical protein